MAVFSDKTIKRLCAAPTLLVEPYDVNLVKPASYDLSVGDQFRIGKRDGKLGQRGASFSIPSNEVAFVITEQTLTMPCDAAASVSICHSLLKQGVILAAQSQIDPGYKGKVVALLYNFSNKSVKLKRGEHLVTIEFRKLDDTPDSTYSGTYQNLDSIEKFAQEPIDSSLLSLRREIGGLQKTFYRALPLILSAISVAVAVITVILMFNTIAPSVAKRPPERSPTQGDTFSGSGDRDSNQNDTSRVPGSQGMSRDSGKKTTTKPAKGNQR
ncbi:hypothetical protein FJY68_03960 [candidate division WOR-3 bacterium]|uniref:dUTPase-like domain-containing protein n=1 Tax=candidate division WOR-3 bacterium TaxID=2052148 RepID=A0A937XF92_UNCW3|nr:hypothetical protein [candidate division WOR-3 bacterium]